MKDELYETLSAFTDGARVDPELLDEALSAPEARRILVAFASLRAAVAADETVPSARVDAAIEAEIRRLASPRSRALRGVWAAAAAVVLVAGGVLVGTKLGDRDSGPRIPEPTREVHFTEGVDWFQG